MGHIFALARVVPSYMVWSVRREGGFLWSTCCKFNLTASDVPVSADLHLHFWLLAEEVEARPALKRSICVPGGLGLTDKEASWWGQLHGV